MPAGGGWLQLPWSAARSPDRQVHAPASGCAWRGAPARCRRAEGIALPGLIRRLLLTLTAGALGAAVLLPAHAATAATDGACPDDDGVTVVVDFQELGGGTVVRCAPGPQASGLAALEQAGFTIEGTASWGTAVVCRIDGRPVPADEPCTGYPPVSAYWSYWQAAAGGSWGYASTGPADAGPSRAASRAGRSRRTGARTTPRRRVPTRSGRPRRPPRARRRPRRSRPPPPRSPRPRRPPRPSARRPPRRRPGWPGSSATGGCPARAAAPTGGSRSTR